MSRENPHSQGSATVSEVLEGWSQGLSHWMELTRGVEGQSGLRRPRDQGEARPVGVRPGLLAQALQFRLGLGMAKGPQCPRRPGLGPMVLLLVAGVQAAHVQRAEEAARSPSVVLHQGLQAGELGRQVLGEGGASVPASPSQGLVPGTPHPLAWDPAPPLQRGGNSGSGRSCFCSQHSQAPSPLFLSSQPRRD